MPTVFGVILAAGRSSRMGQDKAQLTLAQQSLLQRAKALLTAAALDKVLINAGYESDLPDIYPGLGPLAGIHSFFYHYDQFDVALFLPIDMPLITVELIDQLINHCQQSQRPVYYRDHYLPLAIPNEKHIRNYIQSAIQNQRLAIKHLINLCQGNALSCQQPDLLANANTPQDWQQVKQLFNHQNNKQLI